MKPQSLELDAGTGDLQISSTQKSMSFADGNLVMSGSGIGMFKIGSVKSVEDTSNRGFYIDGSGNFMIASSSKGYIQSSTSGLTIKSEKFDLDAGTINLQSANSGRLSLGTNAPSASGVDGIFLSGSGYFSFQSSSNSYIRNDADGFKILFPSFSVSPSGHMIAQSGEFRGHLAAESGFIGNAATTGWNIDGSTIADTNTIIQLD